jgi:hypothetical protein
MRRILIACFVFIMSFSVLPISQAATPTWFTPSWDKTVTDHTEIQVRNNLTGTTMMWVGLPTAITTDKVGCANVTYVLGPTLGLDPAGSLTKYAEFEVYAWSPLGQNLGSLRLNGQRGEFAPMPMTSTTQKICISDARPGSKNEVLLKMKAGIRVIGDSDIVPLSDVTIQLNVPSTITCIKGKIVKKVTAIKPKCPAGYKLKK